MANYLFSEINNGIAIENPTITICNVIDNRNGTANVWVEIVEGNPSPNFNLSFKITLGNQFTYTGDQPMKVDVDAWYIIEIQNYEVT